MIDLRFRDLDANQDAAAVLDLMRRGADYVQLEDGRAPDAEKANEFLTAIVPGSTLAQAVKLGIEHKGALVGIVDMGFGYPRKSDAYIGLLLLDARFRGQGLGRAAFLHLQAIAKARGANRLLIAVLEANPKGMAFWLAQGFAPEQRFPAAAGDPMHHARQRMTKQL